MANQQHVFVHIGDTHVGPGERIADKLAALDQIIVWCQGAAAAGRLAAILWPGDLFHAKSTIEDRNALAPRLQALANRAPVILVYGNHDAPGDLDILGALDAVYPIHVSSRPEVLHVSTATGTVARVACLPYPHRAGLVGAGVAHDDLGQTARQLLEPQFALFADELRQADANGEIALFIGHVNVGGSLSSTGQPQIGREIELDPGLLGRLDSAVYKGLNHIHKHQVVAGDTVYAGSICRQDFGENEPKGFIAVTIDEDVSDSTATVRREWAFIPLDVPAQYLVEGQLTRDGFVLTDAPPCQICDGFECVTCAERGRFRSDWTGADVKVRYTYKRSERGVLDQAHILAEFAGCRLLKLDPIAEVEREVRAPEVVEAVTVDAKAEAYCGRKNITWTPAIAAKLTALQQQTPEAILAEVSALAAAAGTTPAPSADRQVA